MRIEGIWRIGGLEGVAVKPAGRWMARGIAGISGAFLALMLLSAAVTPLRAAELVLFERAGCAWCLRWHQEIGPIYPKTDEGRQAPLRRVSLDRGPPQENGLAEPVFYTPTFVLMDGGREIGRITGYGGEDAFWSLLTVLAGKLRPRV